MSLSLRYGIFYRPISPCLARGPSFLRIQLTCGGFLFIKLFLWLWLHTISARRRASRRAESLNQVAEISCFCTVEQSRRNLAHLLLSSFVYLDCVEPAIFSNLIYICYFVSYIKPGIKPINYLPYNKQLTLPYGKRLLPLSQLVHVFCFIKNRFIRNSSQTGFLT